MNDLNELSRTKKYKKRRNLNRLLLVFFGIGLLFIVFLIYIIVSNNKTNDEANDVPEEKEIIKQEEENDSEENHQFEIVDEEEADQQSDEDSQVIEYVEPSDDNVIEAYKSNWQPIGTTQEGPHTTNYNDGSDDRIEIKRAVSEVTEIDESELVEWRVENGGDQKVIATVSDKDESTIYRIYLTWVNIGGWQVKKIEILQENDKK